MSMRATTISLSRLPLDDSRQRNGNTPYSRPSLRSVNLTNKNSTLSETLVNALGECYAVVCMPLRYPLIMEYAKMLILTYAERFLSVPLG